MALARLVVIEGPDVGSEFAIPLRGGHIGRGDDSVVQLSDPSVSRAHCGIQRRDGRLVLVDAGSRNSTLVNGQPVTDHVLEDGDEITVGKTRLVFLPDEGGLALLHRGTPSRVTMEVGSGELFRAAALGNAAPAHRYLASLAGFADRARAATGRSALLTAACQAACEALGAERTVALERDAAGRIAPVAAAAQRGDASTQLAVASDVVEKVMTSGKSLGALGNDSGGDKAVACAPLWSAAGTPHGLLYAERRGAAWHDDDVMALTCLAHLTGAALAGEDARALLADENQSLVERLGGGDFVGDSPEARGVLAFVAKVGPSDATVLVTGESGSGKEMVARAIHQASRRAKQAFIAVNCAAMTQTLVESELFGHEKGAFTGATERKVGRFEAADKGTLFLDEVGELPLECQTKFLRVLEEQVFERVGGTRSLRVDVRVVAATNRDLGAMVARGQFREDLFYRLSVIHAVVPPLRARPSDVPLLAEHFLARLKKQVARRVTGFAPEAMQLLAAHPWPGNVRELRNAIERAIVLGDGPLIRPEHLPPNLGGAGNPAWMAPSAPAYPAAPPAPAMAVAGQPPGAPAAPSYPAAQPAVAAPAPEPSRPRSLKDLEREGIIAALTATGGNKAQAAVILEIDRSTLYKKLKDYGIEG